MKILIWAIIIAVGLAALPFGGSAVAGQGQAKHAYKVAAHAGKAGKAGKHHGKKHNNKPAGKNLKHK